MATPVLGRRLHLDTDFVKQALRVASRPGTFDDAELDSYADSFREPARAAAASSVYRYALSLGARTLSRRSFAQGRLTVPTLLFFGDHDAAISTRLIRDGWQENADDMTVEFPDAGHFIVNEDPELVAERARAFFA